MNGLENKKYEEILAVVHPKNPQSARVVEKAGFRRSKPRGEFYEDAVKDGRWERDMLFFSLERPAS